MPALPRSSLRRLLFAALFVAVALAAPEASAAGARLRLVKRLWGTGEVRLVEGGHERLLERYAEPISVQASEVSPDGRRAFVWYYGQRAPLELAVYDVDTSRRTARFAPGFGGELHFTAGGNLIHVWGCGTNCQGYALYDEKGKTLRSGVVTGHWLSPTRRYLLTGPSFWSDNEPVKLYDLDLQRTIAEVAPPRGDTFIVEERVRWDDAHGAVSVQLGYLHGKPRRLLLRTRETRARRQARRGRAIGADRSTGRPSVPEP